MGQTDHPSDADLLATAEAGRDAVAAGPAADHLAECAACRARLAAYRSAAQLLAEASPAGRAYCPPRAALIDASLSGEQALGRDRHLAACPLCAEDLADLRALEVEPAPGALETVRGRVVLALEAVTRRALQLLEATLPPVPTPALAPARGEGAGSDGGPPVAVQAVFGDGALELTWSAARGAVDLRAVARGAAPRPYRLELRDAAGAPLESRASDEQGAVSLTDLEPGCYRLAAFGPQRAQPELEVELELRA